MAFGLMLSLAAGAIGLTPLRLGVWGTSEAIGLTLHVGALLAALGLALAARAWPGAVASTLQAPVVLVPFALAVWSTLVAPAAEYPWLSVFGAPQTSEGALLFLDMAVWSAATMMLRDAVPAARVVAATALAASLAFALLFLGAATRIFFYPDWLAFFGLFTPAIVVGLGGGMAGGRDAAARWLWGAALAAGLVPLAMSRNLAAIAAVLLATPLAFGADRLMRRRPHLERWWRPAAVALAIVAPLLGLAFIWLLGASGFLATISSRMLAAKVALAGFGGAASRWLTGQGWGHDVLTLLRGLDHAGQTGLDQSWDLAARDYFHSHHGVLEALISAGIPGAVLFAALPVAAIIGAEPRYRALAAATALAYAATICFWFQSPASFAFQAIAFAALARRRAVPAWRPIAAALPPSGCALALAGAVAFLLPFGVAAQRQFVRTDVRLASAPEAACADFPAEAWRGDLGLARLYGSQIYGAESKARTEGWSPALLDRLAAFVCLAEQRSARDGAVYLLFWGLDLRGRLAHLGEFAGARARLATLFDNWSARLDAFGALAPGRSDVAVGYYGWAIAGGRRAEAIALGNRWLARRPDDPISLWFTGNAMLLDTDDAIARLGLQRMSRALALGVDRMIPVDPAMRRRLQAAGG
ncbi:hypothetical protein [Desertibaculum subflavum]|uniref:hypothetical protein n=1 Tax=Desertibaculum subflavum TaxID=2268458 RepID=UPI0013C52029